MSGPKLHKEPGDGISAGLVWYACLVSPLLCLVGAVILRAVQVWGKP
jgi:hypothetical protein